MIDVTITTRDIARMRIAANELLTADGPLPRFDDLAEAASGLRTHLHDLIPALEAAARAQPDASALVAVQNARACLAAGPGPGLVSATRHARSLARELRALCGHYETLTAARVQKPV